MQKQMIQTKRAVLLSSVKTSGRFFQIFWAFPEKLNFKNACLLFRVHGFIHFCQEKVYFFLVSNFERNHFHDYLTGVLGRTHRISSGTKVWQTCLK